MHKIEIVDCECCGGSSLVVGDQHLVHSSSRGVVRRMARVFSEARGRPDREALRMLCQEIGYEPDEAVVRLAQLRGDPVPDYHPRSGGIGRAH